jgi:hypothetical protein
MKKIYLSLIALLSGILPLLAQQEATLHSMQSLPQAHYTNPAIIPQQSFYLGLPGISSTYLHISNTGFNYNSIIERNQETDSLYLNLPRFQDGLAKKNYLSNTIQTDLLSLGLKVNSRLFLMMNSSLKAYSRFMYPEGLSGLFINGNAAYLGETVAFSPELEHISYLENSVGASYVINNNLTLGARFKFLKGIGNINTQVSDFSLSTDAQTYALQLQGNMQVRTAGISGYNDYAEGHKEFQDLRYSDLGNGGFAMDLGATYRLNNRLYLGLSALNLGAINWTKATKEYYLNETTITFKGVDIREVANGGSGIDTFMEELEAAYMPEQRELEGYRSALPTQFYLSARYELHRNLYASGLLFAQLYNGHFAPAFSAAMNKDFGRRLSTSISYTAANRSHNLGTALSFRLTPVQFYLVSDNLVSTAIFLKSAKSLSLRAGMNLVFGYRKSQTKLPYAN